MSKPIKILFKIAGILLLFFIISYIIIWASLPSPNIPDPIDLDGSTFERFLQPYDGTFFSIYIIKNLSKKERLRFLNEWERINIRFNRRNLSELIGFEKPINNLFRLRCYLIINCRDGTYLRFMEEYLDQNYNVILYISRDDTRDDNRYDWLKIPNSSTIDELARSFCEPSAI